MEWGLASLNIPIRDTREQGGFSLYFQRFSTVFSSGTHDRWMNTTAASARIDASHRKEGNR